MSILKVLADYKDENAVEYTIGKVKGYTFIRTASHGYLCLGSDDNGYSDALRVARLSNYSYILDGGLVYLEEDCDAPEFLKLNLSNE